MAIQNTMIDCIPTGLCSWNFRLDGGGHSARLEFNWAGEQGKLRIDGKPYEVRKHGLFSGEWSLDAGSDIMASAQKSSIFTRSFELQTASGTATLRAESPFGRTMLLEGAGFNANFAPVHPFTRRASITGKIAEFHIACFAFWLTVLLWRRAAQSDAS